MTDNPYVNLTSEYGLVVRRNALQERGVRWDDLLAVLEVRQPLDCSDRLLSFGPHFGQEALDAMMARLTKLGLVYFDDFFEFAGSFPKWCTFSATCPSSE
jgi:hypothetical protein